MLVLGSSASGLAWPSHFLPIKMVIPVFIISASDSEKVESGETSLLTSFTPAA